MKGKKMGLVLGSGGARGSAHVGVLKTLEEHGIQPDVIVGSSMGAEVGGTYAAGVSVEDMAAIWRSAHFGTVVRNFLPTIPWSGWCSGREKMRFLRQLIGEITIEELPITYVAVATDLESGLPYSITEGSLARAIRASISVPGLLTPVWIDGHLLIDGGVSNPVPVDVARQLGAEVVVAVDVLVRPEEVRLSGIPIPEYRERILGIIRRMDAAAAADGAARRFYPSVFSVLFQMSTVFQKRVSDLSLRVHPPDVLIQPDFSPNPPCYSDVKSGIEAGEAATRRMLPRILEALNSG